MKVFAEGVESFVSDPLNEDNHNDLIPNLSCDIGGDGVEGRKQGGQQESSWSLGETFHRLASPCPR
jgi:hypothetical protein